MKKITILLLVYMLLFINHTNAQVFTNYTFENTSIYLCDNEVNAIAIDAYGNKWFGTNNGISKFDGTNWTTYDTLDGLVSNNILAIAIDAEGNKWFASYDYMGKGGVSKFDGTTWTTYTTADGLAGIHVTAIAIDSEGNKWFGTYGGGVSKFDGTTWTTYTEEDGLVYNWVNAIAIDSEGNKWFGTWEGVSKLSGGATTVNIFVSPSSQIVGFEAGSTEFNITSNAIWTISNAAEWLSLSRTSLGTNATITANFTTNNSPLPRDATITIYGPGINTLYVTVTQSGNPYISVPSVYDLNLTIYPNPVKDNLYVKLNNATLTNITISVVDVSGRRIIQRNFDNIDLDEEKTLDLSFMKSGLYFLEIKSEKNSRVYKIIKE